MAEKALASAADAVFLDLEDAVAPDSKAEARKDIVRALKELEWRGRPTVFRANALDTPYFYRDLMEVVEGAGDSLDAVMIPKVNRPEDLCAVSILLSQLELAMDLEKGRIEIEAQIEWDEAYPGHRFHYAMQRIVVAARAAGLRVLDGPVADYGDEEGLRRSCLIARSLGFDGKWCIHPAQIEVVNQVFSPTEEGHLSRVRRSHRSFGCVHYRAPGLATV